jgi:hypothetical protein
MLIEKRRQEKEYLAKMLVENENNQARMKIEKEKERLEDVKAQEEYSKMLEKQEQDRHNEFQSREKRAQDFMNKMADTVIKNMDQRQMDEDQKIKRYEMEKELRQRMDDERKMKQMRDTQHHMRGFLYKQMDEKKGREGMEKALNDEQADMWRQDKSNYEEEERRLNDKIKRINKDNEGFLKRQMDEKVRKDKGKMNKQEFLLNKPLLREINTKKKDGTINGASLRGEEDNYYQYQA